jgi:hypothetical protein
VRHPDVRFAAVLLGIAALVACSPPSTDIVATSTEAVGEYHVIEAQRGDRLVLRACVAEGADTDRIAARIVQQLVNHGYSGIELELVAPAPQGDGVAVTRVSWNREQGRRIEGQTHASRNPCAQQAVHGRSS